MNRFRTLRADEIECRIATVKPDKGVSVLLYKTARTDADLLDETFGPEFWENDFKLIDGVLYGGIGIDYDKTGEGLVWKWDAGTESNTEAEKGRASDAFKRAGFKTRERPFTLLRNLAYLEVHTFSYIFSYLGIGARIPPDFAYQSASHSNTPFSVRVQ